MACTSCPPTPIITNLVSSNTKQGLKQGQSTNTGSPTLQHTVVWIQWALSIQPKIPEISDDASKGTDHFRYIRDQLWSWSSLTGPVISVGRTEMSRSIWQNCCPQYRSFVFCNQTRGGLGRVFATGRDCSIGHVEFPKFQTGKLLNGKRLTSFTYKKDQRGLDGKANDLMLGPKTWSSELRQNLNQRPLLQRD